VVVDPDRVRARWGSRWAAFAEYDMDRAAQRSVRTADNQLLRRINMPRIPPDQLVEISAPVALIWSRNDRITRFPHRRRLRAAEERLRRERIRRYVAAQDRGRASPA
jgi:pimeloyl-ACP methyl ester carboxylesterase